MPLATSTCLGQGVGIGNYLTNYIDIEDPGPL